MKYPIRGSAKDSKRIQRKKKLTLVQKLTRQEADFEKHLYQADRFASSLKKK